jgi:predicted kinase
MSTVLRFTTPFKTLIIPVGLPGSGKSTLLDQVGIAGFRFGADDVRERIFGDVAIQGDPARVHHAARAVIEVRMAEGFPACYDATNLTRKSRAPLFALAEKWGYRTVALASIVPYGLVYERNAAREVGRVPDPVLTRMHSQYHHETVYEDPFDLVAWFDETTTRLAITWEG